MISLFGRQHKEPTPSAAPYREEREDREIVFSKSVKAGKRVYYLDVKRDRKDDLFLSITESKRKAVTEDGQFVLEKHKIFLYKEDFDKFEEALKEVLDYMRSSAKTADEPADADAEAADGE